MSDKFTAKWGESESKEPFSSRVKESIRPQAQLKPRLDRAVQRLEGQIQRLDQTSNRLSERDKSLFAKVVEAYSKHDQPHATAFANELTEIRKTEKTVLNARLALEQIVLRLRTVTELGDMVHTLGPIIGVLGSIRTAITGVLPDAGRELEQIGTELNGIITSAGQSSALTLDFATSGDEAQKILNEAASIAEERAKEKFPELPSGTAKTQTQA